MSLTLEIDLIAEEQIPAAAVALTRAFFNDPLCVYTEPDPAVRMRTFSWLFAEMVREGVRDGAVYTKTLDGRPAGTSVWFPPSIAEHDADMVAGSEMDRLERRIGANAARRFNDQERSFERIHRQLMPGPHWYLALLGVAPHAQGQGIGSELLTPGLDLADQDGLPCYLETFVPRNLLFYQRHGFRVIDSGLEPRSQISFWAMKRDPRA